MEKRAEHTPEPWKAEREASGLGRIVASLGEALDGGLWLVNAGGIVTDDHMEANAHRIVACVNALAGVEDPVVELAYLRRMRDLTREQAAELSAQDCELARLRRVEAAARAYVEADPDRVDMGPLYDALEQAVAR